MKLKWFKLAVDLFDNCKMKYIRALENGRSIMLIWIELLCLAAKKNDGGAIYIVRNKLTTPEELSILIGASTDEIKEAVDVFNNLDMIRFDRIGNIVIKNFDEFQWGDDYLEDGEDFEEARLDSYDSEDSTYTEENEIEIKRAKARERKRAERLRKKHEEAVAKFEGTSNSFNSVSQMSQPMSQMSQPMSQMSQKPCDKSVTQVGHSINYNIRGEEIREDKNKTDYSIREERRDLPPSGREVDCEARRKEPAESHQCHSVADTKPKLHACSSTATRSPLPEGADPSSPHREGRGIYKNVFISDTEYSNLKSLYPDSIDRLIEELSTYLKSSGKEYDSHCATLSRWAIRDRKEAKENARSGLNLSGASEGYPYSSHGASSRNSSKSEEPRYSFDPEEAMQKAIARTFAKFDEASEDQN